MQENWIGKSQGLQFSFKLSDGGSVEVYSTRPDTILGVLSKCQTGLLGSMRSGL